MPRTALTSDVAQQVASRAAIDGLQQPHTPWVGVRRGLAMGGHRRERAQAPGTMAQQCARHAEHSGAAQARATPRSTV